MKAKILLLISLLFADHMVFSQTAEGKNKQKEKTNETVTKIKKMVEARQFEFKADRAIPLGYESVYLTTGYNFLKISGNKAEAYLPFFGRAYNIGYSDNEGGIKFDGKMLDYTINPTKNENALRVKFSVKNNTDSFDCTLEIYAEGRATLNVNSQNRAFISYYGTIQPLKKVE